MEVAVREQRLHISSAPRKEILVTFALTALGLFVWKEALFVLAAAILHPSQFWPIGEEIIRYLSHPEVWPTLFLRVIFGFITIGCGLVFPGDVERCIIDKEAQTVRFCRTPLLRSFISTHRREMSQDLEHLDVIQVEECTTKNGAYRIRLVFEEGCVHLPVTQAYHFDLASQIKIAEQIRQFVGLTEEVEMASGPDDDDDETEEDEKNK